MTRGQLFLLVIVILVVIPATVVVTMQVSSNWHRIKRAVLGRFNIKLERRTADSAVSARRAGPIGPAGRTEEERTLAELERLQAIIEDRKQLARDTDITYHLWGFYRSHFRYTGPGTVDPLPQDGEWYDVKIISAGAHDGFNKTTFELKGARYTFSDDEERHGWVDKIKRFSMYLHDDSRHCLIEIPMKVRIDKYGRHYSLSSEGPKAFLPGEWVSDFISVKLKHQRLRNQEIREQKHQERLWEIEELKDRFGISD
jgi:hypothetical protein